MSAAIPLISAALAALVAWIVALRQGRTAHENWVLDKRFDVYSDVVSAMLLLVRKTHEIDAGSWKGLETALLDIDVRHTVLNALTKVDLIAPSAIRERATLCAQMMWSVLDKKNDPAEFIQRLDGLIDMLREDLLPKSLR